MTEIVESLKNELSSVPFFSRVFLNKKKIKSLYGMILIYKKSINQNH